MRLTVLLPGDAGEFADMVEGDCTRWALPGTELDLRVISPAILDEVAQASRHGTDGILISCAGDPAVDAAREIADVPVAGGLQPALLTALSLGERVGVISVARSVQPMFASPPPVTSGRCRALRAVDVPPLDPRDKDALVGLLYAQAHAMVAEDEADAIVLGCTGFMGVAEGLQDRLAADASYVPVIDPTGAALLWLQTCVRLGARPNRTVMAG